MKLEFSTTLGEISSLIYYFKQKACKAWQSVMSFEFEFSGSFKLDLKENLKGKECTGTKAEFTINILKIKILSDL